MEYKAQAYKESDSISIGDDQGVSVADQIA